MSVFILLFMVLTGIAVLVVYSRMHFGFKAVLIPALIFSSIVSFLMLQEFLGQPLPSSKIASRIVVYGQAIDKDNDAIYLLISENNEPFPPKYVKYKYNQDLHKALSQGKKQFKGEAFQLGSEKKGKGEGEEGNGKKGDKNGKKKGKGSISLESANFQIYKLPPPVLPEKK